MRTKIPTGGTGTHLPTRRNRPGPKGSYSTDLLPQVIELVGKFGARNQDLADYFGVALKTVEHWIRHRPEFAETLRKARILKGLTVAQSLYNTAVGYSYYETVVGTRTLKEYNEQGKPLRTVTEPVEMQIEKQVLPSAWAGHKILSILHRDIWAETKNVNVDHHHSGEITHRRIDELSMNELPQEVKEFIFDLNLLQLSDEQNN